MTVTAGGAPDVAHSETRFPGKYLSVTSFRPDGSPVATPVWFIEHAGRLYVDTDGTSYKVKRIRANPTVLVAPCTPSGRLKGEQVTGRAEVATVMPSSARHAYERKYRVDRVLVLPLFRVVQVLQRKKAPSGPPVALIITPEPS